MTRLISIENSNDMATAESHGRQIHLHRLRSTTIWSAYTEPALLKLSCQGNFMAVTSANSRFLMVGNDPESLSAWHLLKDQLRAEISARQSLHQDHQANLNQIVHHHV